MADEVIDLIDAEVAYREAKSDSAIRYQGDRLRQQKHRFNEALDAKIREIVREALDSNSHS
jgi:hypothetical protein